MSSQSNENDRDEDGFHVDEWGNPVGYCNACGEEASPNSECCEEGEVVPYDSVIPPGSQSPQ